MSECIFCAIAAGDAPAEVVRRDERFVAFRDISPKAPVHVVVVPVRHIGSLAEVDALDAETRAAMLSFIATTAREAGLEEGGYRLVTNHGPDARQSVFHLHWHVMGGTTLSSSM